MAIIQNQKHIAAPHTEEHILVVPRATLFSNESWQGLQQVNFDEYLHIINNQKQFLPRSQMELDPCYKQIIPYLVFTYNDTYFLMQRQSKASEQRLKNKYTLGIGGHIRQEDMLNNASIFDWAHREFHEEIAYNGSLTIEPIGILNDDSNDVGKVHIGFVFLLHGNSSQITVKSELKSGHLVSLNECKDYFATMETWSQIVFEYLINQI